MITQYYYLYCPLWPIDYSRRHDHDCKPYNLWHLFHRELFLLANNTRHLPSINMPISHAQFGSPSYALQIIFHFNIFTLKKLNEKKLLVKTVTAAVNGTSVKKSDSSSPTSSSNTFQSIFSLNLFAITQPPEYQQKLKYFMFKYLNFETLKFVFSNISIRYEVNVVNLIPLQSQ